MNQRVLIALLSTMSSALGLTCYIGFEIYENNVLRQGGSYAQSLCQSTTGTSYCTRTITGSQLSYTITKGCSGSPQCTATLCTGSTQYGMACCCNDRELCNGTPGSYSFTTVTLLIFIFSLLFFTGLAS